MGRIRDKQVRAVRNVTVVLEDGEAPEVTLLGGFNGLDEHPGPGIRVSENPALAFAIFEITLTDKRLIALKQSARGDTANLAYVCDRAVATASLRRHGLFNDTLRLTFDPAALSLKVPRQLRADTDQLVAALHTQF
jgi:hypothetical protein